MALSAINSYWLGFAAAEVGAFVFAAIVFWLLHFTITMVLASPILWYGADRARWNVVDLRALFVPFAVWAVCMAVDTRELETPLYLSMAITVAAAVRVTVGHRLYQHVYSAVLLILVCAVGLVLYFYGHFWPALFPSNRLPM